MTGESLSAMVSMVDDVVSGVWAGETCVGESVVDEVVAAGTGRERTKIPIAVSLNWVQP